MSGVDRHLLAAGAGLVLLVNAVVLAGVGYNRSGEPDAVVSFTERELERPWSYGHTRDNNGIALGLRWRVATPASDPHGYGIHGRAPEWLDAAAMRALGFPDPPPADGERSHRRLQLERDVWLALELGGEAHARELARAERRLAERQAAFDALADAQATQQRDGALREFEEERDRRSRLFVIDAGLDADALRVRYPDRDRFLIVSGRIRPHGWAEPGQRAVGYVSAVHIDSIHVPVDYRSVFEPGADSGPAPASVRYQVTLAYGRRHEPWIVAAESR